MRQLKRSDNKCIACSEIIISRKFSGFIRKGKPILNKVVPRGTISYYRMKKDIRGLLIGQFKEFPVTASDPKLQQNIVHNFGRKTKRSFKTTVIDKKTILVRRTH
jgi:hypothetical protein